MVCAESRDLRVEKSQAKRITLRPYCPGMDGRMWVILVCLFAFASTEHTTYTESKKHTTEKNYTDSEEVARNTTSNSTAFELIQEANGETSKLKLFVNVNRSA